MRDYGQITSLRTIRFVNWERSGRELEKKDVVGGVLEERVL